MRKRKLEVVRQTQNADCAAACLTTVLRYYGRDVSLEEVIGSLGIGASGTDARAILKTAKSFGVDGRGIRITPAEVIQLDSGSILHWQASHFVVFEKWRPSGISIIDPAVGRRRLRSEDFVRAFTGVALVFDASQPTKPAGERRLRDHGFFTYTRQLLREWRAILLITVTSGMINSLALLLPIIIGIFIDRSLQATSESNLVLLALLVAIICTVLVMFRERALIRVSIDFEYRMSLHFLSYMLRLPYRFFEVRAPTDLLTRLNSHAFIGGVLVSAVVSVPMDGLLCLAYIVVLMRFVPIVGFIALILTCFYGVLAVHSKKHSLELTFIEAEEQSKLHTFQAQILGSVETIKANGGENRIIQRWSELKTQAMIATVNRLQTSAVVDSVSGAIRVALPIIAFAVGAAETAMGSISLGSMVAAVGISATFFAPLQSLLSNLARVQVLRGYLERIDDVFASSFEEPGIDVDGLHGAVSFESVEFRYSSTTPVVIREVNAVIQPGECVLVVGGSGSGKTTLLRLLAALLSPTQGRILLDGLDIHQGGRSLRSHITLVPQRPTLFAGTVRENITLLDRTVTDEQLARASTLARLHEDILRLPQQYDTRLGDGGEGLSGSQRQRLAIARALLRNGEVLAIDEPASALDESGVSELLDSLSDTGRTIIVATTGARYPSWADRVFAIDDGRLSELPMSEWTRTT